MLPVISLNNEKFSDIVENAQKMIPKLYQGWTDFNRHDPGITFIELFAWLKEMQQYHLDQIGIKNNMKFLKLFGIEMRHTAVAKTHVMVYDLKATEILPRRTRLYAGDTAFETLRLETLSTAQIVDAYSVCSGKNVKMIGPINSSAGAMFFYIFGRDPVPGNEFYMGFDAPMEKILPHSLYFGIFDDYQVKRNPIGNADFFPLARLCWEYYTESGWKAVNILKDGTNQFICSGSVDFSLDESMLPMEDGKCWIRIRLLETDYEVAPVLSSMSINNIEVQQKETISEYHDFTIDNNETLSFETDTFLAIYGKARIYLENGHMWSEIHEFTKSTDHARGITHFSFEPTEDIKVLNGRRVRIICYEEDFAQNRIVGEADGFPYQRFDLELHNLIYEDFHIMVSDGNNISCLTEWCRVTDFDASKPTDRHYVFNDKEKYIEFGDCEHGMAPEGIIFITGCATSLGRDGNVKEGKINRFARNTFECRVINHVHASGGENSETVEESFMRFRRSLHKIDRAVTYEDFETLARATPGLMIKNCKAIPVTQLQNRDGSIDVNCVSIVVQPFTIGRVKKLGRAYMQNIYKQLNDRHLVGTKINVLSPEYIGIDVFGEIEVKPYYRDAKQRIEQSVEEFFSSTAWDFGSPVQYSTIYGIIDTLDCVGAIRSLTINAHGKGIVRSLNGDVILPPNGLVYLKESEYVISEAE